MSDFGRRSNAGIPGSGEELPLLIRGRGRGRRPALANENVAKVRCRKAVVEIVIKYFRGAEKCNKRQKNGVRMVCKP